MTGACPRRCHAAWLQAALLGVPGSLLAGPAPAAGSVPGPAFGLAAAVAGIVAGFGLVRWLLARERRWRENETNLRNRLADSSRVIENIGDALIATDASGKIIRINRQTEALFGYPRHELLGQPIERILPSGEPGKAVSGRADPAAPPASPGRNPVAKRQDGQCFPAEVKFATFPTSDGPMHLASVRNISDRLATQEALRRLQRAVEQSSACVVITDRAGHIEYVNPRFTELTGYTRTEVLGKNPRIMKSNDTTPEEYRKLWRTILEGRNWEGVFHNKKKNGDSYWEKALISPIYDMQGVLTHFLAIKEDITEQRRAERARVELELQLFQAQKLEAVGKLAAGMAHEINTPTQFASDNVRFLDRAFAELQPILDAQLRLAAWARTHELPAEARAFLPAAASSRADYLLREIPVALHDCAEGLQRISKMVKAMKHFAQPETEQKSSVDLNQAIENTTIVAASEWREVAELVLQLDPGLPLVPCLPGEVNQVILNLLVNAAHAVADRNTTREDKGVITISTHRVDQWAEIRIADTGTGIAEENRQMMFVPFFTTKEPGKGTGHGLALARAVIADRHQGRIWFETETGRGTTFIFQIPLATAAAATAAAR